MDIRMGIGFDAHRLIDGKKLIIGGVDIPFSLGLDGHSDADVLVHAIMDALLGAAALGDIGTHFPDTSADYKDISSLVLLQKVLEMIKQKGYTIGNIDSVIIAQAPKMSPFIHAMHNNIAASLSISKDRINIKATTTEHMGFTGRKEGIAACATAVLVKTFRRI